MNDINIVKLIDAPVQLVFTGGINPRGAWQTGASPAYATGDGASYAGSSSVAIQAPGDIVPTNPVYWQILAEKGIDGESAFVYIAYASDNIGTGFTLTFN